MMCLTSNFKRSMPHWFMTTGDLLQATVSPENDIWAGASGHSLRDLVQALTLPSNSPGESALQQLLPHLQTMLNDAALQYQLKDAYYPPMKMVICRPCPANCRR